MARKRWTDLTVANLSVAKRPYIQNDPATVGLGIKVLPSGRKVWLLKTIYPANKRTSASKSRVQTRRNLGEYGKGDGFLSLEAARVKAREWLGMVKAGLDPAEVEQAAIEATRKAEERAQREAARKRRDTFGAVAERYIDQHLNDKRRGRDDAREIRKHLIPEWGTKPIVEITPQDVKALIKPLGKRTSATAHIVLNHVKRIYSWALNDDTDYGITVSPAQLLKPEKLIGPRKFRTRVLNDDELFAFWRASGRLGYPARDLYRLIALTGVRKSEASGASWSEFNFRDALWSIPAERFKSEQMHLVPLSPTAVSLLEGLPRRNGQFVFSTTGGYSPVNGFSKPKARLDAHMLAILRALARKRGEDPTTVKLEPFVIHDIRRTVRTRLSELQVDEKIAELVIGHGKKGLSRVYDHAKHLQEMREALELWADRLAEILAPSPEPTRTNVVKLERKGRAR